MTATATYSEMAIPKPRGAIVGAIVLALFIFLFVALGVFNLYNHIALIPSIILLLLITAIIWCSCKVEGVHKTIVNLLGVYSSKHFAQCIIQEDCHAEIWFGYKLLGRYFFYFTISVSKIESVHWRTGQATDFAGRDMNDWSVALWFDHDDPVKSERDKDFNKPDQDVYIVGSLRRKELTVEFGHSFVSFLCQAGAVLVQGDDECTFARIRNA